jgi:hypothetical protein
MQQPGQQGRGDVVAQQGLTKYLRVIRVKYLTAASGDELAALVRAWFIARNEQVQDPATTVTTSRSLSEDRELIDWTYRVSDGAHHMMILYAE